MALIRLKGVHVVRVRLRSGVQEYHYAWRGGPRLQGAPGSQQYLSAYHIAHQGRTRPQTGTVRGLVAQFKASPEFTGLDTHTARAYRRYLDLIIGEFGDLPMRALDDREVRRDFIAWRDTMAATPRTADYAMGTLKRLLAWAEERVLITENHAEPIKRLHRSNRSDSIWTDQDFAALAQTASAELSWAVELASFTALRQSDLIRLPWSSYDGSSFVARTSKTGTDVLIPATPACRELMARIPKRSPMVLTTERGHRPWTADGLRSSLAKACARAKVHRTFHDLRRTAATRLLAYGDITDAQLAMMLGWSTADLGALKRKYVSRAAVAEAMLAHLDRGG